MDICNASNANKTSTSVSRLSSYLFFVQQCNNQIERVASIQSPNRGWSDTNETHFVFTLQRASKVILCHSPIILIDAADILFLRLTT